MSKSAGNLLLILSGVVAGFLAIEAGLRGNAFLEYRGALLPGRRLPPDPLPGTRVRLGQMIRRSSHRRLIYELRPNLQVVYEGGAVTTNSSGFRGKERPIEREPDTFRIVGIGDSFMFGQGVHDDETHLAQLELRLNQGPRTVCEVINLAVPGYNAVMEVETLQLKGLRYRPDLVIVEFIGNDLDLPNFIVADPHVLSLEKWFLGDLVLNRLRRVRGAAAGADLELTEAPRRPDDPGLFEADPSTAPVPYRDMVGWLAVEHAYRALHALSRQHGFRVVLLHWESAPVERRLVRLARQLEFGTLNLSRIVDRHAQEHGGSNWRASGLVQSESDNHPSALGHRIVSEAVERFLIEEGLFPRNRRPQDDGLSTQGNAR